MAQNSRAALHCIRHVPACRVSWLLAHPTVTRSANAGRPFLPILIFPFPLPWHVAIPGRIPRPGRDAARQQLHVLHVLREGGPWDKPLLAGRALLRSTPPCSRNCPEPSTMPTALPTALCPRSLHPSRPSLQEGVVVHQPCGALSVCLCGGWLVGAEPCPDRCESASSTGWSVGSNSLRRASRR